MEKSLGVVMDPIQSIKFLKDTSLSILLSTDGKGIDCFIWSKKICFWRMVCPLQRYNQRVFDNPDCWYELDSRSAVPLDELDVVLMRKDPPFDSEFIYSTYILERLKNAALWLLTNPKVCVIAMKKSLLLNFLNAPHRYLLAAV